ncbi:hypothetical protein ACIF8T_36165 [Streptomyces sp. NPDC085946]|uniref:hypothetical protein n=1 Tax=Streptomyces sp. NPDC085946 TaxID=3365744 RepID=UPI0037D681B0
MAAAWNIAVIETVTDPYGQPDPLSREDRQRVRQPAKRGRIEMVIARWPTSIAPNRSRDLRYCEIIEPHKQGVSVRCSRAPLRTGGAGMTTASMLHDRHRLLGHLASGTVSGRTGVLRGVAPEGDAPKPVAWLLPAGGGIEWTTPIRAIEPVTAPTPDRPRRGR